MSTNREQRKSERASTYFVQDRQNKDELVRVKYQDHMVTASMGGVLPEQPEPASFQRVLDVGCGTGGWILDAAQTYSTMSFVGIDISSRMIDYARAEAESQHVSDQTEFHVMDALKTLEFPDASFDLVNLRLGVSYLRTWDWPCVLSELHRLTHPGGVVRLTDNDIMHQSNSPALTRLDEIATCALFRAGHLFSQEGDGLTSHLARLLKQYVGAQVQTRTYALEFQAGTPQGEAYYEDMARVFKTTLPFIQKWACAPADYDTIYQQALKEMRQSNFHVTWNYLTAWTIK